MSQVLDLVTYCGFGEWDVLVDRVDPQHPALWSAVASSLPTSRSKGDSNATRPQKGWPNGDATQGYGTGPTGSHLPIPSRVLVALIGHSRGACVVA